MAHLCEVDGTSPPEYIDGIASWQDCDAVGGVNYEHLDCGKVDDMLSVLSWKSDECPSRNSRKYALSDFVTRV